MASTACSPTTARPCARLRDLGLGLVDRAWLKRPFARGGGLTRHRAAPAKGETALGAALVELARFVRQHDRDAVADRVSEAGGAADQLLPLGVVVERGLGQRADQDLKQLRIEAAAARCFSSVMPSPLPNSLH